MSDIIHLTPPKKRTEDEFPGRGAARCYVCGERCIDHDIGPCPQLNATDHDIRAGTAGKPISDRTVWRRGGKPLPRDQKIRRAKLPSWFSPMEEDR